MVIGENSDLHNYPFFKKNSRAQGPNVFCSQYPPLRMDGLLPQAPPIAPLRVLLRVPFCSIDGGSGQTTSLGGRGEAEAEIVVPKHRRVVEADGDAAIQRVIEPRAAAIHAERTAPRLL